MHVFVHAVAGMVAEAAPIATGSMPGDRSSLFMCLFCSRNANLCDPYYACYPGSAGGGQAHAAAASLVGSMTD